MVAAGLEPASRAFKAKEDIQMLSDLKKNVSCQLDHTTSVSLAFERYVVVTTAGFEPASPAWKAKEDIQMLSDLVCTVSCPIRRCGQLDVICDVKSRDGRI